ncbi:MAG: hypothetical protein H7173_01785 [Rhodoferax sp.]|nr:hypothetical protein [Pseudorhodobacter sp.]
MDDALWLKHRTAVAPGKGSLMIRFFTGAVLALLLVPSAGTAQDLDVATLYRSSALDSTMRLHVATFDAVDQGPTYNSENCQLAAQLFQDQPGITVRFWCEPGRYRASWK